MKNKTKNTRQSIQHYVIMKPLKLTAINYRLMHALFHIKTPIIPRDRYRPGGFSPRDDIGRGMITVLIWKKAYINLFITYFNIELKRTNLTSHTDTQLMDMSVIDIGWGFCFRNANKSFLAERQHFPNDN